MIEREKQRMTCEEFEIAALDLGGTAGNGLQEAEAREHLRGCSRCATLHENWQLLQEDLHAVGAETRDAEISGRVELRLRQEFRTQHKTLKIRRAAVITSWGLAAAALLVVAVIWANWRHTKVNVSGNGPSVATATSQKVTPEAANATSATNDANGTVEETLLASNDSEEFTLLPQEVPGMLEDGTVLQVRMQRGSLGALGLAVNEERAADWIQVDLLVGEDGQPQAVRLPQSSSN
jgi:anti-sigma factor RsiW